MRTPGQAFLIVFKAFMGLVYIALGLTLALRLAALQVLPSPGQEIAGSLMALYGCFRIWNAFTDLRTPGADDAATRRARRLGRDV